MDVFMNLISRQISCIWRDLASSQSFSIPTSFANLRSNSAPDNKKRGKESRLQLPQSPIEAIPAIGANVS